MPSLLDAVPLEIRQVMWLQHDGAPENFDINVRNHVNVTYPNRWIGRGGPVPWPARSPDLTPLDYSLSGSMKALVSATPVTSEKDLIARVHGAIGILSRQPHLLDHVRASQAAAVDSALTEEVHSLNPVCNLLCAAYCLFVLLTCGTDTLMVYCAHSVRFRTWVPS